MSKKKVTNAAVADAVADAAAQAVAESEGGAVAAPTMRAIPDDVVNEIHRRMESGSVAMIPWYAIGWDWSRQPAAYRSANANRDYRSMVPGFRSEGGWKLGESVPCVWSDTAQASPIRVPAEIVVDYSEILDDNGNQKSVTPVIRDDVSYWAWRRSLPTTPVLRGLACYTRGEYLPLLAFGHWVATGSELEVAVRLIDPAPDELGELDTLMDENNRGGVAKPFSVTDLMFRAAQYCAPPLSVIGDSALARHMGIPRSKAQKYYAFGRLAASLPGLLDRVIAGLKLAKDTDGTYASEYKSGGPIPPAVFGNVTELRALTGTPESLTNEKLAAVAEAYQSAGQVYRKGRFASRATVEAFVRLAMGRKRNAAAVGLSASDLAELAGSYPSEGPAGRIRELMLAISEGSMEQAKVAASELLAVLS